ncbi:winged helix-turn-helix domain-containing protein [Chthonobacter rhizosphaerae]|uniref:winged helix-turn-helix domain-containing protein n=1 Tax=Chthonobacter rhizosphaerae TaxID=2735553 RepID=UPI0015EEC74A|nr:winged helix-turn-helix domain-containing protein [Chthonobacter rhizosphaerae]
MTESIRFADLIFAADFSSARREDGAEIRFTRTERRLLADLAGRPGILRTRNQLLDATTEPGSSASDRNIDFTIVRLRAKLGDSARKPVFISTRYGEGYIWIAPRTRAATGAFLVIGPFTRMGDGDPADHRPMCFAENLAEAVRAEVADGQDILVDAAFSSSAQAASDTARFYLELLFVTDGDRLDCISVLRRPGGPVLSVRRDPDIARATPKTIVSDHLTALWRSLLDADGQEGPLAAPIALRLVEAAAPFISDSKSDHPEEVGQLKGEAFPSADLWRLNETRLRKQISSGSGDAVTKLLLAVTIHTRYVIDGWRFLAKDDPRQHDEAEMRDLLLGSLPELLKDPQHALSAANLLFFLGPVYRPMALDIAEDAFRRTTMVGHALSTLGPLRCFTGDFDSGLALLRQARGMCKPGTVMERYIVSFICQNLLASGDFAGKDRELVVLTRSPISKGPYRLVYATPGETDPSLPVRIHLRVVSAKYARSLLLWSYYICARNYVDPTARENVIVGLAGHLRRRFGDGVVPPEVAAAIPAVLGRATASSM